MEGNGLENEIRFIRLSEVLLMTTIPKSTLMAMIADNKFPPPVDLGERSRAWVHGEVKDWMQKRVDNRDKKIFEKKKNV